MAAAMIFGLLSIMPPSAAYADDPDLPLAVGRWNIPDVELQGLLDVTFPDNLLESAEIYVTEQSKKMDIILYLSPDDDSGRYLKEISTESGATGVTGETLKSDAQERPVKIVLSSVTYKAKYRSMSTYKLSDNDSSLLAYLVFNLAKAQPVTIDDSALVSKITEAEAIDADGYTEASHAALAAAIAAAQDVLVPSFYASQGEIDEQITALEAAIDGLVLVADTTALTVKITEAAAIAQGNKSAAAYATLQTAVTAARAVLDKADATQSEIDSALTALQTAVARFNSSADITNTSGDDKTKSTETAVVTDLSAVKVTVADRVWTGKKIATGFVVSVNGKALTLGSDYTIASTGANENIGEGTVTIVGQGGYGKSATATFNIVPKAVKISSAKTGKKSLTVKWSAAPKAEKITKYQVRFRLKGVKSWSAAKTVSASNTSFVVKKLKEGKKYEVQARVYKTVKGVKYYSAWSAAKTSKKIK
jgi:hypothetical protein